jgi:hypothetical protein
MTKTEARKIATAMNAWRRDGIGNVPMPCTPEEFGLAIDVLIQPNTIAENIRNAAINWPEFLGCVECHVLMAFAQPMESPYSRDFTHRVYMLFVAEALES